MPTLPSALSEWKQLAAELGTRQVALFLDYDGTLTPIVARPELAVLTDRMRETLKLVASRFPTVIVSGRAREDVARHVGLPELIYAGSHGFDISGPEGGPRHEVGADFIPMVRQAAAQLRARTAGIDGVLIEDKGLSVSVHHRAVSDDRVPAVESIVDEVVAGSPRLQKTHGKKVFELRPALEWDKGKAVLWLLHALDLDGADVAPIYVGDDVTDEDAFRVLASRGVGILVAEHQRPTQARFAVRNPDEVRDLLMRLASRPH